MVGTAFEGAETKIFPIELLRFIPVFRGNRLPRTITNRAETHTTVDRFLIEIEDDELLYIGMELGELPLAEESSLKVLNYLQEKGAHDSLSIIYGDRFCTYNEDDICVLISRECVCTYFCPYHEFKDWTSLPSLEERVAESHICFLQMTLEKAGIIFSRIEHLHLGWYGIEF